MSKPYKEGRMSIKEGIEGILMWVLVLVGSWLYAAAFC